MPAGYFGDDVIEQVRSRVDIVGLVSEYVKLRKTGKNYVGLCPFHEERTPSFSVDPDKQLFYCFGCGAGGSVFNFLMRKDGLTFPEAVRTLAERAGVTLPSPRARAEEESAMKERRRLRSSLEFAQKRYREMLDSSHGAQAREYLEGRGLTRETIDKFGLGYAPDEWEFVASAGRSAGFDRVDLLKAGLLIERPSSGYYDRFRHRVTFPIWDTAGELVGFGGRSLGDEQPKYLNSPDTPLFRKGKELYALNLAKPAIRRENSVCVMEGYMDVITSFQHGIDYTVAGMGTALSREQARALLLLAERVFLVYDQDDAGKRAARRSIDVFREGGGRTSVVAFQGAKDPDEFLRARGKESFVEILGSALPDISFIYEEARKVYGIAGIEAKLRVKDAMLPVLAALTSEFEVSAYLEEISREMGVLKDSLAKDVEMYRRKTRQAAKYKKSENRDTSDYDNQSLPGQRITDKAGGQAGNPSSNIEVSSDRRKAEEGVIRCLLEDTGLSTWAKENLTEDHFADPRCREALRALGQGPLSSIEDEGLSQWLAELCARSAPVPDPKRMLGDYRRRLGALRLAELQDRMISLERQKDVAALDEVRREFQALLKQVKSVGDAGEVESPPDFPRREDS
ncbi:MAG: DNA primase [Bacillota bacterium]